MNSDLAQVRDSYLDGTVAFPLPFPSLGRISFDVGRAADHTLPELENKEVLILQEVRGQTSIQQVTRQENVMAVFIAGTRDGKHGFQISQAPHATDLDEGEWFFGADVNRQTMRARLNLRDGDDVSSGSSVLRGIIFVGENHPVLSVTAVGQPAGDVDFERRQIRAACTSCIY